MYVFIDPDKRGGRVVVGIIQLPFHDSIQGVLHPGAGFAREVLGEGFALKLALEQGGEGEEERGGTSTVGLTL